MGYAQTLMLNFTNKPQTEGEFWARLDLLYSIRDRERKRYEALKAFKNYRYAVAYGAGGSDGKTDTSRTPPP